MCRSWKTAENCEEAQTNAAVGDYEESAEAEVVKGSLCASVGSVGQRGVCETTVRIY